MKSPTRPAIVIVTTIALLCTAFAPLQSAPMVGDLKTFDPSTVLQSPPTVPEAELLAFDMNRTIMQQTRLIRYQATEYQRKVAEQRARAFVAAQRRTSAQAEAQSKPKPKPKATPKAEPKKGEKPKPAEPLVEAKPPVKKLPRYIAVDTVKDKRASPKARKVVMIWDTHAEALVGNNIYDVQNPPRVGETTIFETYSAEYIGAGL